MSSGYESGKTVQLSLKDLLPPKTAHYLTVIQGVTIERAVPITERPLVLGRDPSRPFFLPDTDVSRSHCEVRLVGNVVLVRDLASMNGTFVDGIRVTEERPVPLASKLHLGRHALRHELLSAEEVARHEQFTRDLERARSYVSGLLPAPLEEGPVRAGWCYVPSSILGGDSFGYHDLGGGRLALYVLDVCGHGVGSAMHSASVLNAVRRHALPEVDFGEPDQVLRKLNDTFQMEDHGGMYFSIFYGVLDCRARRLRYSSAGHPPAIVIGTDGRIRSRLAVKNPPIGALPSRSFDRAEIGFEPGERLYVFSDGVYEILDREGRERSLEDFERDLVGARADRSAGEPNRLYDAARSAAGTELLPDDFTMLVVELAPTSAS